MSIHWENCLACYILTDRFDELKSKSAIVILFKISYTQKIDAMLIDESTNEENQMNNVNIKSIRRKWEKSNDLTWAKQKEIVGKKVAWSKWLSAVEWL